MDLPLFQIDAFADAVFAGNPAAVCPLDSWLPDDRMQAIAAENNLSETAFFVPDGEGYALRWFTPVAEVDLCGHATLATAFLVFERLRPDLRSIAFSTRVSDTLTVTRDGDFLVMDFPRWDAEPVADDPAVTASLGAAPRTLLNGPDLMAVFDDEAAVRDIAPDFRAVGRLPARGVIVTAPGRNVDFVSRFFAPAVGIDEDPVTGSAHCLLAPYWAGRLGKTDLVGRQVSRRGGTVRCTVADGRVRLAGRAVLYLEGTIHV
ncbi:MAG: PhzF family phenazine biosynthesis protein [Inquilinaceae bacterium]